MKEDLDRKERAVPPGIEIPGIPARKLVNHAVHTDPRETTTRLKYVNGHRRILVIAFRFGIRILGQLPQ